MKRSILYLAVLIWAGSTGWASNKAGIVIKNSTDSVTTRCVEFEEDILTVEELLKRSGFALTTEDSTFGTLLDYLHDDGMQDGSYSPDGEFWNFFLNDGADWISAEVGISDATVANGSLVGFGYGSWGAVVLPAKTFADVCEITSKAALVIDHNDGSRVVRVVEFFGESLSGMQLLQKSGLTVVTAEGSHGTEICAIDNEGQPAEDCNNDPQGRYWSLNLLNSDNEWQGSMKGSNSEIAENNTVHGYRFGYWGEAQTPITRSEIFELPSAVSIWGAYWN
jgi:hypothetical protein